MKRVLAVLGCAIVLAAVVLWTMWPTLGPRLVLREFDNEPVSFRSGDAVLAGTLVFPNRPDPSTAVVLVHGSGKQSRLLFLANALAGEGLVVLTYDKRGVGQSGGAYEGVENISASNLSLLADDAAQAVSFLRQHPRTKDLLVGFVGLSQAGWIAPLAAAMSKDVSFLAFWSGPVSTVSEELHFSALAEDEAQFWDHHSREAVAEHMKSTQYRADDVDPRVSLQRLSIPGLWLFGGRDQSIPVDLSIVRLEELIANGHPAFEYKVYPQLGHTNYDADVLHFMAEWIGRRAGEQR